MLVFEQTEEYIGTLVGSMSGPLSSDMSEPSTACESTASLDRR